MVSRLPFFLVFFLLVSFLPAQDKQAPVKAEPAAGQPPASPGGEAAPFPLALLLETIRSGAVSWQPDWPLSLPADAFRVNAPALSVTVETEGGIYAVARNEDGLLTEFPFPLDGGMVQVKVLYNAGGLIDGFSLGDVPEAADSAETSPSRKAEFLDYRDKDNNLARITMGEGEGTVFFAFLSYGNESMVETWYDPDGNALGVFNYRFANAETGRRLLSLKTRFGGDETEEWRYYDSGNRVSEINAPSGRFSALYTRQSRPGQGLPRYWELPRRHLALQWDERDLLVRITGTEGEEAPGISPEVRSSSPEVRGTSPEVPEYRYGYTLDERGNWIERRETRMIRALGGLVPSPGLTVKRAIVYETTREEGK